MRDYSLQYKHNIQITEIGDKLGQLTLIMDLGVHWNDNRIQLIKENVPIFLSNEDQNHIWSPQFRIGTDLISHNKQGDDEIILIKEYLSNQSYVVSAHKLTYLSTTFKCEMNLKDYPFDYHNCTIEVSILYFKFFILNWQLHAYRKLLIEKFLANCYTFYQN